MVQAGGLEPPTSGSTDRRSNQLSYACKRGRKLEHFPRNTSPKYPSNSRNIACHKKNEARKNRAPLQYQYSRN